MEKLINWDMAAKAMNTLPKTKQQWVSKLASKFLPYRKTCRGGNYEPKQNAPAVHAQSKTRTISSDVQQTQQRLGGTKC